MKRNYLILPLLGATLLLGSCVSKQQFADLQTNYQNLQTDYQSLQSQNSDLQVRLAESNTQVKSLEERLAEARKLNEEQRKALTWDVERGAPNYIVDEPWQTCNCIGGWHYNTSIYERGSYKSAAQVVKMLVDIVSKNGNLLLSIPLRADGTYDEKEAVVLDDLEAWMTVNGESIFDTRPWKVFGEGPVAEKSIALNAQGFNDGQYSNMDYRDIRFNQKGRVLYVTAMSWPENRQLVIKSLRKGNPYGRKVGSVTLLGYGKVKARQTSEGLVVTLPVPCNKIAPVLKIK